MPEQQIPQGVPVDESGQPQQSQEPQAYTAGDPLAFLQQEQDPFGPPRQQTQQAAPSQEETAQQAQQRYFQKTEDADPYFGGVRVDGQQQTQGQQPQEGSQEPSQQTQAPQEPQPSDSEIRALKERLEQYESLSPLTQYISSDPRVAQEVFQIIERHTSGQAQEQQVEPEPEPPQQPERPADYNEVDAYADPQSESWRYRTKLENWRSEMNDFRVQQAEKRAERLEKMLEERTRQEQEQAQLSQVAQYAISKGVPQEKAQEFVQFITNPQVSQDDLIALWQLKSGQQPQQQAAPQPGTQQQPYIPRPQQPSPQQQMRAQQIQNRNQRLNVPLPSAAQGGNQTAQRSPADALFDQLVSLEQKSNPWG